MIAIKNYDFAFNHSFLEHYDGIMKFQPREVYNSDFFRDNLASRMQFLRLAPKKVWRLIQKIHYKFKTYDIIDSNKIWKIILEQAFKDQYPQYNLDIYECGYMEWDNTARYKNKAKIFTRPSKEQLEHYTCSLFKKAREHSSEFVFWNAWNEWSEGTYLEPDTLRGYESIEIIQKAIDQMKKSH